MRYIRVDLHTTQVTVCYLAETGCVFKEFKLSEFKNFKNSLQIDDQIAVESTSNSNWFYEECKNLVTKITVVNTYQFRVIAISCNKTDENDARLLAEFLSKDMLPTSKTKDANLMHLQSSLDTRAMLIKQRTMLKNEIHAIFVQNGLKLKSSLLDSNKGLNSIKEINLSSSININLQVLIDMIITINNQIKILDEHLEQEGSKLCGYEHLTQIKGLGCITAIMLLIAIGNINNFDSAKKLSAYFGIVPRVRNSNDNINHGSITKRGDKRIRSNLVQCALSAIKYNAKLKEFYNGIKLRKGHGKAIIATARKLLSIIFYTLKHSWYFTDFASNEKEIRIINWA